MRNNITCLLFDFDGVIADTDLGRYKTLKQILLNYNIEISKSFSKKDLIGLSTKGFLTRNFQFLSKQQIEEIVEKRHRLFFSNLSKYCIPYKGMKESIEYLSSIYDLAVVTTNSTENVKVLLKHLGIIDYFKWIIGRELCENENLIKTYKPIPKIIDKKISECIVIEDSNYGVNAAKKEGFFSIRFDPENIFEKGNENVRVKNYADLIEVIKKLER